MSKEACLSGKRDLYPAKETYLKLKRPINSRSPFLLPPLSLPLSLSVSPHTVKVHAHSTNAVKLESVSVKKRPVYPAKETY